MPALLEYEIGGEVNEQDWKDLFEKGGLVPDVAIVEFTKRNDEGVFIARIVPNRGDSCEPLERQLKHLDLTWVRYELEWVRGRDERALAFWQYDGNHSVALVKGEPVVPLSLLTDMPKSDWTLADAIDSLRSEHLPPVLPPLEITK